MTTYAAPLTERDFMDQVTQLATLRGWDWFHPRPARTLDSWRTAGSGTLAKGWPDLALCRGEEFMLVELKRDGKAPTPEQTVVLNTLRLAVHVEVWRPADWDRIERLLR